MKLKPDCIRAILLTIEENTSYQSLLSFEEATLPDFPYLTEYPLDEVLYHLKKCDEAGLLCGAQFFYNSANIEGLHFRGHEFLSNVRKPKIWDDVKGIADKVGTTSLQGFMSIASNVVTALINAHLGLL